MVVAENMEESEQNEGETLLKRPFTIFGEPIIKTRCQRNAMICAISGGIMTGLVAFLFTSRAETSTRAAMGGFFVIGVTYSCYCGYDELQMRKQRRLIRQAMYHSYKNPNIKLKDSTESSPKLESA